MIFLPFFLFIFWPDVLCHLIDYLCILFFYILYIVLINSTSPRQLINGLKRPFINESDFEDVPSRKVIKNPIKKQKLCSQRFHWSNDMVESLLECLNDLKSQYKLKGLDFESDLIRLYQKVRTMMTKRYITGEFGTVALSEVEGHDKPYMKAKIADENKAIKIGHERVKQKIKDVRQDYRKTVNKGRRNGIGKLVINN